jgi:hypothetical protein
MAIKSKGRARGRRTVSAAPRRALVVRKPPIWRRPWIWIVLGVLAVGGIAYGVNTAVHNHSVAGRKDREKLAMTKVFAQFRAALPTDRRAVPPDVLVIFPSATGDLPKIGKEIKGEAAKKRGKEISDQATESFTKLQAIQVNNLIPTEFADDRAVAADALFLISRGITLYQQVGGLVEAAADLPRPDQKAVIAQATALTQQAGGLFDQGYRKLLNIANRLGIPHTVPASVPITPGLPSPSVSPSGSGSPSPAPSDTPSATPTGSASPSP